MPGVDSPRFDITAKIPKGTTKEEYRLMLQNLLAERLRLTTHNGTKEMPVYNLVVGKNGPKLTMSAKRSVPAESGSGPGAAYPLGKDGFPTPPPDTGGVTFNTSGGARLQGILMSMQEICKPAVGYQIGGPACPRRYRAHRGIRFHFALAAGWNVRGGRGLSSYDFLGCAGATRSQAGIREGPRRCSGG